MLKKTISKLSQFFTFIIFLVLFPNCTKQSPVVKIIPEPAEMTIAKGVYRISSKSPIYVNENQTGLAKVADFLIERIEASSTLDLDIQLIDHDPGKGIYIHSDSPLFSNNPEAYELVTTSSGININASSAKGAFYAVQTLLQLLPPDVFGNEKVLSPKDLIVPIVNIKDEPRYAWRGMHLDVGRHLFPVEFIKKYIDLIAMHKMNIFHWHLTEDQGWRIEIQKYPRLTDIGAWRETENGEKYGGFYTQDQIQEVVEYAASRFIDVMPEIELPGHSVAALASYPELACTEGPFKVRTAWGVSEDVYCAGKEITFDFLHDVIDEVVELFPFEYFHIGGDECPKVRWEECDDCQKRIRDENLKDEHELQSYFISRIEKYLATKNKKLVGWDEILEGGLAPNATVMSWRGEEGGIAAAQQKHDVIMTPNTYLYFDYYQGDPKTEPKAIGGFLPMEKVYSYDPTPDALNTSEAEHILGAQGNVWTEYISTSEKVEYMALPRMCALAELVWTPQNLRDYERFIYRMGAHYARLDAMDVNYRIPPPVIKESNYVFLRKQEVVLHKAMDEADIRYTTDGTDPDANSLLYTDTLTFDNDAVIKVKTVMKSGQASVALTIILDKQAPEPGLELDKPVQGLSYSIFKGSFKSTTELEILDADERGETSGFNFPKPERKDSYGMIMAGHLKIEKSGVYRFYTKSDDGTVLKIEDKVVVNNDGWHAPTQKSGAVALGEGWHRIQLDFVQAGGAQFLEVLWSGPDFEKQEIPKEKLASMMTMMPMMQKR